jgi:protein TonB
MLANKSKKARIEGYSKIFFQLGLVLSLLIVYLSIEWKSFDRFIDELSSANFQVEEIEDIPITERLIELPPPPPPPPAPEKIQIVADEQEVVETVLESTETDETEAIENLDIDNIEEVEDEEIIDNVPFAVVEEIPVFPGCKGNKAQKKKCFMEKIREHVSEHYNTELSKDIGLVKGKKKVYVQFKIDKNGYITDTEARGPHKRLEKEALRVVNKLPKMTPGKQRGQPVAVSYTLPITLIVVN